MSTAIATTLTPDQIADAQQQSAIIASTITTPVVDSNTFVFFAAFDGTNNDGTKPTSDPQSTNVYQLYDQFFQSEQQNQNLGGFYAPGPGTEGTLTASSWLPPQVTQQVIDTANLAYSKFALQASEWLDTHPSGSVTTMLTSFSRGGASAAIFSQLLFERGLVDPRTGQVLMLPGEVGVSGGVIFDPVDTGVNGNLAFVNVQNVTIIRAEYEYRSLFQAADYTGQPGILTYYFTGNHSDIGGGQDNGLSALTLTAATNFFSDLGLTISPVPDSRLFDATKPIVIHIEDGWAQDNVNLDGTVIPNFTRLTDAVSTPEFISLDGGKTRVFENISGDIISISKNDIFNGKSVTVITRDSNGTLMSATTTEISLNHKVSITSTDINGDGKIDQTNTFVVNDDGTKTANITLYTDDSTSETVRHLAANGTFNDEITTVFTTEGETYTTVTTSGSMGLVSVQYVNGKFQGLTAINGMSVSTGLNQLFLQELQNQGITSPTIDDIYRMNKNLGDNATGNDLVLQNALQDVADTALTETDYYGRPTLLTQTESTMKVIGNSIGTLTDALSLVRAIQSGKPLPITVTGLRLAADLDFMDGTRDMPNLGAAASVGSAILSIYSLANALENGDGIAAISSAAYVVKGAADAALFLQTSGAISELPASIGSLSSTLNTAIPYLNIVNSIAHGDALGAGLAAAELAMMNAGLYTVPYIGWAYAVYSIVDSLFGGDDIPDPWGTGRFVWDGTSIKVQSAGETGGNEAVSGVMQSVITAMNSLIEQQRQTNPTSSLGIIANRMPTVAYDMSGYRYTDIDPLTGVELHPSLRFDTSGNPYNAIPGSTESYQSIGEAIIRSALEREAIAPMWEVQTAKMQTDAGDPKAGLTEEARAGRDGQLAHEVTGDTQTFRPVTLDLSGNNQIDIISKATSGIS
ncbi:DUF2235 domain-containing protein, partial [bacterium]|nr:DUF2235 domain-containing protein [bacterium]MBU1434357.1 DUF2235 domain-containing protein [bacterium]MBU1503748.1 DUF2235 domain-containing protein [bacterium]